MKTNNETISVTIEEYGLVLRLPTPMFMEPNKVTTDGAKSILEQLKVRSSNKGEREQLDAALEVMSQVIKSGADLAVFRYCYGMEAIVIFDSIQGLTSFRSATETNAKAAEQYVVTVLIDMIELAKQDYDSVEEAVSKFINMYAVARNHKTKRCLKFAIDMLECAEQLGGKVQRIVQPGNEKKLWVAVSFEELEETQKFKKAVENLVKE